MGETNLYDGPKETNNDLEPVEDPKEDPTEDPKEEPVEDPTEDPEKDPKEDPKEEPKEDPEGKGTEVKYELALPEDSLLDDSVIDETVADAKERGLSNEDAQEVLNSMSKAVSDHDKKQGEDLEKIHEGWRNDSKSDKEFGGDKLTENVELAHRVVEKFGSPEFKKLLEESHLGDHPEWIRTFVNLGKAMQDDKFVHSGSTPPAGEKLAEDVLYGETSPSNAS